MEIFSDSALQRGISVTELELRELPGGESNFRSNMVETVPPTEKGK